MSLDSLLQGTSSFFRKAAESISDIYYSVREEIALASFPSSLPRFALASVPAIYGAAVAGCGSEENEVKEPCRTNDDCKENRVCLSKQCQDPAVSIELADGRDNNGNGLVDEWGSGIVYFMSGDTLIDDNDHDNESDENGDPIQPQKKGDCASVNQLFSLDLRDFSERQMFSFDFGIKDAKLSPDNSKAILSKAEYKEIKYYLFDLINGRLTRMFTDTMPGCGTPADFAWLPDGRVAYSFNCPDGSVSAGIYESDVEGGLKRKIVEFSERTMGEYNVAFGTELLASPNGRTLAFRFLGSGFFLKGDIHKIGYDGREFRRLTDYILQSETMAKPQFGGNDKIYYYLGKWLAGEVEAYSVSLDGSSPQFELMVRSKETDSSIFEKSKEELEGMSEEELLPKLWYLDDGGYAFKRDGSKAIVLTCERPFVGEKPGEPAHTTWLQMFDPVSKRLFEVPYRNLCCNAYPFAWTD